MTDRSEVAAAWYRRAMHRAKEAAIHRQRGNERAARQTYAVAAEWAQRAADLALTEPAHGIMERDAEALRALAEGGEE